ncbi:MAG: hypothetical protein J6C50_00300 [Rickettsiales bacterium]|nr:hypothetical protein [Rickettsiales bacterium]
MQTISFLILFLFISGIGTMFGSLLCCYIKRTSRNFAIGLSFSAGIMIYMSLADLLKKSEQVFLNIYNQTKTSWLITILFCISIFLSAILDALLEKINYSVISVNKEITKEQLRRAGLIKVIIFSLISITIHNIPEGLYVFIVSNTDLKMFYLSALSMILHNILEGIAIAFPIYYIVHSKYKVAIYSFLCGIFEILGLLFIVLLSHTIINYYIFCFLIIFSSALMLYISFNRVILLARQYGNDRTVFIGVFVGIVFMMMSSNVIPNIAKIFLSFYQ